MARSQTTWRPGHCPNPGGRPKGVLEVRELALGDMKTAYAKVKAIAETDGHKQQLAAAIAILKVAGVPMSEDKAPGAPEAPTAPARDMTPEQLEAIAAKGEG